MWLYFWQSRTIDTQIVNQRKSKKSDLVGPNVTDKYAWVVIEKFGLLCSSWSCGRCHRDGAQRSIFGMINGITFEAFIRWRVTSNTGRFKLLSLGNDNVWSHKQLVINWQLPLGTRLCINGSADPTSTAERKLFNIKLGQPQRSRQRISVNATVLFCRPFPYYASIFCADGHWWVIGQL